MSKVKCSVFPSGQVAWHQWKQGAKSGDVCECGQKRLDVVESSPPGKYDGTTMREVMQWASEKVWSVSQRIQKGWMVFSSRGSIKHTAPTLYDALYLAWKERKP